MDDRRDCQHDNCAGPHRFCRHMGAVPVGAAQIRGDPRAEIIADEPIAEKVSADVWGEAMVDMLHHIREGKIAEGLAIGVKDVGIVLSEHFPREDDDENELPDRLIEV